MSKVRTRAVRALEEMGIPYRLLPQAHKARGVCPAGRLSSRSWSAGRTGGTSWLWCGATNA